MKPYKGALVMLLIVLVTALPSITKGQQLDPILKDLINKGLDKSHGLNSNGFEVEQAKVDQQLAKSVFLPKITLNGSYTHLNDDITFDENTTTLLTATQKLVIKDAIGLPFNSTFPNDIPLQEVPVLQNQNILRSSVDVDWVLFSGLEASNALQASRHKETSLNYVGLAEEDKIALKIIETYDQLALVKASKKVLKSTENYLNEQVLYVNKAIENGLATPISRNKIALAKQQLEGKKLEFEHNNTLLIEALHQLTGESRVDLQMLNPQLHSFAVDGEVSGEKRNEIKALEEAEKATQYQAKMLKSNFIPKVALKGHYEFLEENLSLLDPKWYVGVGLKWNVFDGNQSRLKRRKIQLETAKYREQIADANEMIALGISKAEISYEAALMNTKIVQKEVELAKENYEMVNTQFKNNLASINEVLDALNDVEKANFKLQQSYFQERRAVADLLHAKGILNY